VTTTKLLDLLREARYACESLEFEPCSENRRHAYNLKVQIDAVLHAYDTAPARPEWVVRSWSHYPSRASSYRMGLPNTNIEVRRARDNKWSFLVTRHGLKDTLEEAQAAALDAAKEMA
jgi:hypothetical protein